MSKWEKYKLGEFVEINPRVPLKQGNEYSFVEMKDLDAMLKYVSPSAKKELKGGSKFENRDTLFARITPCLENGKICQVKNLENNIGFGSTEFLVFRGKESISDTDFVYYLTKSDYVKNNAIQMMTGTSGRQRVEKSALENLEIIVPDFVTQSQIAQILTSFDDKIELLGQMNQTLETMAQTIFKEWFVDFNFPGFDGELVDGLPKGWRMGKLNDISINFDSRRVPLSSRERSERQGEYPYYGATSILDYVDDYLFDGTYLLMGEDGTVSTNEGFPVLQYIWGKFWVNNHAHILQGKSPFSTEYLHLLLSTTKITHLITGAVQPKINQANMNRIECFIPTENILKDFEKIISQIFGKIKENSNQIRTLTQLRDNLLPKLMGGAVVVSGDSLDLADSGALSELSASSPEKQTTSSPKKLKKQN